MTWYGLYKRIGKQTLHSMQNNKVYAIIDNKNVFLDIKYDAKGIPYLVQEAVTSK